jgi:REP element-mobilizing transposase RayT
MHHRRSIRLEGYDYTRNGAYFVTICAYRHLCLFGDVMGDAMVTNTWGDVIQEEWERTAGLRPNIELDAFVVMPNHMHGIIVITKVADVGECGAQSVGAQCIAPLHGTTPIPALSKCGLTPLNVAPNSLGAVVRAFKAAVTRRVNRLPNPPEYPVWQRNYYEHIIRNADSLNTIRAYVVSNPARWAEDSLYIER